MQDLPGPVDLVSLVASFLRDEVMPVVEGSTKFQLRVAINALDLAVRELRVATVADAAEHARLVAMLGRDGDLDALNHTLCEGIAGGAISLNTPGIAAHLWATTLAKLAVDQPTYTAYRREAARLNNRS